MIVGWQLAAHLRTDQVLDAFRVAIGQHQPELRRARFWSFARL
jgi:hypothetical protein